LRRSSGFTGPFPDARQRPETTPVEWTAIPRAARVTSFDSRKFPQVDELSVAGYLYRTRVPPRGPRAEEPLVAKIRDPRAMRPLSHSEHTAQLSLLLSTGGSSVGATSGAFVALADGEPASTPSPFAGSEGGKTSVPSSSRTSCSGARPVSTVHFSG